MNKEQFIQSGLLEQYALGLTSPEEELVVRQHLETFPELEEQLDVIRHSLDTYAIEQIASMVPLPADIPSRKVNAPPNTSSLSVAWLLAIVLAGISTWLYNSNHQRQKSITQLEAEYAALKEYCDSQSENANATQVYALMHDKQTQSILLKGTDIAPQHYAMAYWSPKEGIGWIDPSHLPNLPANKKYCVWADIDHHMVHIGEFDNTSLSYVAVKYLEGAASLNITLEENEKISEPDVSQLTVQGVL